MLPRFVLAVSVVAVLAGAGLVMASGYPQLLQALTVKSYDASGFSSFAQVGVDNNAHAVFQWGSNNDPNYGYAIQYSSAVHGWQFIESGYGGWAPIALTDETSPLGPGQLVLQNGFWLNANQRDRHYATADALPTEACGEGDMKFNLAPSHVPVAGWICLPGNVWKAYGAIVP